MSKQSGQTREFWYSIVSAVPKTNKTNNNVSLQSPSLVPRRMFRPKNVIVRNDTKFLRHNINVDYVSSRNNVIPLPLTQSRPEMFQGGTLWTTYTNFANEY